MTEQGSKSFGELQALYELLYRSGEVEHPRKGYIGMYGGYTGRNSIFIEYLQRAYPENRGGIRVLDASCGRGHLLYRLAEAGFRPFGTEIVPYLLDRDLKDFDVRILGYHELKSLGNDTYHVVISSDVLEHLADESAVLDAIDSLAYVARDRILICIGIYRLGARNFPESLPGVAAITDDLHFVKKPVNWWKAAVSRWIKIDYKFCSRRALFLFGRKKRAK